MKEKLEAVYELQRKNLIYSPWAKQTTLLNRVKELQNEINEALEEAQQEEWGKFKDEMGDVLWDCLGVISRAEHENKFTMVEVLEHIHQKFTERKPYLLEEREVTLEEEQELWQKIKNKQKNVP